MQQSKASAPNNKKHRNVINICSPFQFHVFRLPENWEVYKYNESTGRATWRYAEATLGCILSGINVNCK